MGEVSQSEAFALTLDEFPVYSKYEPLRSGHIRLLTISVDALRPDTIVGSLSHHDIFDTPKPRYHALSYYWGPPGPTKAVMVDGEEVQLRRPV